MGRQRGRGWGMQGQGDSSLQDWVGHVEVLKVVMIWVRPLT